MEIRCSKCNSADVATGFKGKVLKCESCKWFHLNDTPCSICGKPSVGCIGVHINVNYYCSEHRPKELAELLNLN